MSLQSRVKLSGEKLLTAFSEGGPFERGATLGANAKKAIRFNLEEFWSHSHLIGLSRTIAFNNFKNVHDRFDEDSIERMKGIAYGSKVDFRDIACFNSWKYLLSPDECTVLIAMGDSTANHSTCVLKNSDKVGSEKLVGQNYYKHKEINVVVYEKPDNGNRYIAVAAAGENSIKMGMNDKGIVTASNIARTKELRAKKTDITQVRALDRGWLMTEGITRCSTAEQASQLILGKLIESPMATPGNIEFVDHKAAFIVEGSYDRYAVQKITSGIAARSNRFAVLEDLNDPEDISSYARYVRCYQLLEKNKGKITPEIMMEFSQDHANGPGMNSICRHSSDFNDETSLAAAVMEINSSDPAKSAFHVTLGKPCHSWKAKEAHVRVRLNESEEAIPQRFKSGEIWKQHYNEQPQI